MGNCDGICRYRSPWVVSAALEAVTLFQNERTSCQQCSFHGIASSQSIADPYTQVRKEYERSTITPTLPPTLHFTFHRLECIVPPIRRPRERTELPFECPHTCPGAVSMFGLSKILLLRIPALVVVTKCLPVCFISAAYIRKHQASVPLLPVWGRWIIDPGTGRDPQCESSTASA